MARIKDVRYSATIAKQICKLVEDGMTVHEICKRFNTVMPAERQIYRWKKSHPEFKEALESSYCVLFYRKIDELEELANEPIPEGITKDERYALMQQRRLKLDATKFILAKIAPKFVPELKDQGHSVSINAPQVQIISYAVQETEEKKSILPPQV